MTISLVLQLVKKEIAARIISANSAVFFMPPSLHIPC
jgi:hypothetical protein